MVLDHSGKEEVIELRAPGLGEGGHLFGREHAGHEHVHVFHVGRAHLAVVHLHGGGFAAAFEPSLHEADLVGLRDGDLLPEGFQDRALAAGAQERDHVDGLRVVHDHALHELDVGAERGFGRGSNGCFGEKFAGLARGAGLHNGSGLLRGGGDCAQLGKARRSEIDCKEPCVTIQFAFSDSQSAKWGGRERFIARCAVTASCIIAPMKNTGCVDSARFPGGIDAAGRPIELADYYRVETAAATGHLAGRPLGGLRAQHHHRSRKPAAQRAVDQPFGWIVARRCGSPAPPSARRRPSGVRTESCSLSVRDSPSKAPAGRGAGQRHLVSAHGRPGGEAFQIPGVGGAPIFSPDNRWIAFTKKTPPPSEARDPSPVEKQLEQRFKGRMYDWMNVRFDGRGYLPDPRDPAATPPSELYIVAREGGAPKQLTELGVDVIAAAWRPDSAALALIADSHQRDEYSYERADLWVVDLQGQIRRLTDDGFEYDSPAWSPDGRSLVFRRRQRLEPDHPGPAESRRARWICIACRPKAAR